LEGKVCQTKTKKKHASEAHGTDFRVRLAELINSRVLIPAAFFDVEESWEWSPHRHARLKRSHTSAIIPKS
jgi:hypothetical protein